MDSLTFRLHARPPRGQAMNWLSTAATELVRKMDSTVIRYAAVGTAGLGKIPSKL